MAKKTPNPMVISGINHGGRAKGQAKNPPIKRIPVTPRVRPSSRLTAQ